MPKLAALAIVACACLSQAALASDPAGLSSKEKAKGAKTVAAALAQLKKPQDNQPPLDARRRTAEKFGECIAGKGALYSAAVTFLLSGNASDGMKLADGECFDEGAEAAGLDDVGGGMFPVHVMRSLVADGLVRDKFRKAGPTDFSAVPPLDASEPTASGTPAPPKPSIADQLGECAARISPEEIRRLALTNAASEEETAEVRQLVPTFAQCLPPGVQLSFPAAVLRDSSVLAYARLAFTPAAKDAGRMRSN